MCQTRNMNQNMNQQQGLYPDLSGFRENQQSPSILHFLQALGLLPPGYPGMDGSVPTAPGAASTDGTNPTAPPGPGEQAFPGRSTQENQVPIHGSGQQDQASQQGGPQGYYQHGPQCTEAPRAGFQYPGEPGARSQYPGAPGDGFPDPNWWSYHQTPQCSCSMMNMFSTASQWIRTVFRNSMITSSIFFIIILIHLITPSSLLINLVFFILATGLGLHVPTLVAGKLLQVVVSGVGEAEPVLLVGILLWAAHKKIVRKQPLFNTNYWRNRFGCLRVVINNENYNREHQHQN